MSWDMRRRWDGAMKRKCDVCGCEADDHWMMQYNTGRKTMWVCWDCYKQSQYEAAKSEIQRQKRLRKMNESNKKKK